MQEEELLEAKSIYESNLTAIEEALATDPDDTELRQVGSKFLFYIFSNLLRTIPIQ